METLGIATGTWNISDRGGSTSKQVGSVLGRCALLGLGAVAAYGLHYLQPIRAVRLGLAIAPAAVVFFDSKTLCLTEKSSTRPALMGLSIMGAGLCVFNGTHWAARYLPILAPAFAGDGAVQKQKGEKKAGLVVGPVILGALAIKGVLWLGQKLDVDFVIGSFPKFR